MTYYVLEPKEEWADGYFFVDADSDAEAIRLAEEENPTMSFEILGGLEKIRDRTKDGYPRIHDKVFDVE